MKSKVVKMELIKQIKDAENQAKELVEKARQEAAALLDEAKTQRTNLLRQAQQRRLQAIDDAVAQTQKQGVSQVEQLALAGNQEIAALRESCSGKIQACVDKVLSRLKQAI